MEKLKVLATLNKIIFDVLSVLSKDENKDAPFKIGCKCKTLEDRDNLFDKLCSVFIDLKFNIVKESTDNMVYIERKEKKERSDSCTEELEDLKIN